MLNESASMLHYTYVAYLVLALDLNHLYTFLTLICSQCA